MQSGYLHHLSHDHCFSRISFCSLHLCVLSCASYQSECVQDIRGSILIELSCLLLSISAEMATVIINDEVVIESIMLIVCVIWMIQCDAFSNYWYFLSHPEQLNVIVCALKWNTVSNYSSCSLNWEEILGPMEWNGLSSCGWFNVMLFQNNGISCHTLSS